MHRHGYQGRKFSRERDQRRALIKGLATSLVEHGKIETTLPKAKELVRYIEKTCNQRLRKATSLIDVVLLPVFRHKLLLSVLLT